MELFGPTTILYPPYIFSTIAISLLWMMISLKLSLKDSLKIFFKKELWFSKETLLDLSVCVFILLVLKKAFMPVDDWFFVAPHNFLGNFFKDHHLIYLKLPPFIEGSLATLITMVAIDGASFYIHKAMHTSSWLWKIHRFHHTVIKLNFLATHRQNPLEFMILNGGRSVAAAVSLSFFHWIFPSETPVILVEGMGIGFFIYMFTINLHHSHIPVRYPHWLRLFLISPHVHHLHHSKAIGHVGKNFGVVFSFWDRMHGTYLDQEVGIEELRFGNAALESKN